MAIGKDCAIFAECKYTNQLVDIDILNPLLRRGQLFNYKEKYYFLFSKNGLTGELINHFCHHNNLSLVTLNDILE